MKWRQRSDQGLSWQARSNLLGQPVREFWRRYVALAGYREGLLGLVLSVLLAYYAGKAIWLARRRGAAHPSTRRTR